MNEGREASVVLSALDSFAEHTLPDGSNATRMPRHDVRTRYWLQPLGGVPQTRTPFW
jgi:hypothetical protein